MQQSSFSALEFAAKKKLTRRERLLREIDAIAPWADLIARIEPHYPRGEGRGPPPIGLARMLRMYVVQQCLGLSDEGIEDAVYDSQAIRDFIGIDLARESAPDATTVHKFRRLLQTHGLTQSIFEAINAHLAAQGLLLRQGSVVDATLISAPSSTKNSGGTRDPAMYQTKKGNRWHFGSEGEESGDEGFVFLPNEQGSSRWLVLTGLVVRKANDRQLVRLAERARDILGKPAKHPLHFRTLKHEQRVPLARLIGQALVRVVSVLIHKPSISQPEIFQQQRFSLYRYASRLLLERVSWLCRDHRKHGEGDGRAELIFSNRSAMSYDNLRSYLQQLKDESAQRDVRIDWGVIDPQLVQAVNHDQLAGLQLADAAATGIYFAVNPNPYAEVEERYLRLIAPVLYRHEGRIDGYGLKFWCENREEINRVLVAAKEGAGA